MEHEGASLRILIVDDDKILAGILAKVLENHQFVVDATSTGEGGLRFAKHQTYDTIVLDIMLPTIDGLTVLKRLRAEQNQTPVLLLTEEVLSTSLEDLRDRHPRVTGHDLVDILEVPAEPPRELPSDARFARTHEADKENSPSVGGRHRSPNPRSVRYET